MLPIVAQTAHRGTTPVTKVCNNIDWLLDLQGCNCNWNGTCRIADIILPSTVYAEKEGTFTNCDGRVQRIRPALGALGASLGEQEILSRLAKQLGIEFP